eukprot:1215142-Alexandrium_andersonii.AAC.1
MLRQWLRNRWKRAGSRWKLLEAAGNSWKRCFALCRCPSVATRRARKNAPWPRATAFGEELAGW